MSSPKIGEKRASMMTTEELVKAATDTNNRKHKTKAVVELRKRNYTGDL